MDQTNHIKSVYKDYIKGWGMRTQIFEDKRLNATTQQCVHHMKTILNLVHIDISKDEAIYAPLICNTCYSKLQHFVQNTATERSLSLHCYAQLKTVIFGASLIPCIPSSECPLSAYTFPLGKEEEGKMLQIQGKTYQ